MTKQSILLELFVKSDKLRFRLDFHLQVIPCFSASSVSECERCITLLLPMNTVLQTVLLTLVFEI
jgi:hypothetical protein